LVLGVALAQQAPSIEDMLSDSSDTQQIPTPSQDTGYYDDSRSNGQRGYQSVGGFLGSQSAQAAPAVAPASPYARQSQDYDDDDDDYDAPMFGRRRRRRKHTPVTPSFSRRRAATGGMGAQGAPAGGMGAALGAMMSSMGGKKSGGMFGQPSGGHHNAIMDSLLHSVESKMPYNQKRAGKVHAPISQESRLIVSGVIKGFMHKIHMNHGEKQCLEHNIATITADVVGTAEDIYKAVKAIMKAKPGGAGGIKRVKAEAQGTLVSAGLDASMKVTSLITLATTLLKNCVRGDALDMMKEAGKHFIDARYLGHRLLISGVDVAHKLADAIIAYEKQRWHKFGKDIGVSLRKIFLSNSDRGQKLPEGVPEEAIVQETTAGLMSGFFVEGTGVEITDAAVPDVDIQLDLHRCITGNHEFFKEVWLAMWNLIAQLSIDGVGSFQTTNSDGSQPKWMGEMMIAMMQVPMALNRCNLNQDSQQMLMEAIQSIKYVKVHFLFPQSTITADEATKRVAKAVQAWTNWDFKGFGKEIGRMLREFVLLMYPQQYSVDPNGRLRRQLVGKPMSTKSFKVMGRTLSPTFVAATAGSVALSMAVAFAALRVHRAMRRDEHRDPCASDHEDAAGNLLEVE
jgi:hypothetical protein